MEKKTDKQVEQLVLTVLEGIHSGLHRFIEEFSEEDDKGHNERTQKLAAIMGSMIATQLVQRLVDQDQLHIVERILDKKRQETKRVEKTDA